MLDRRTLLISGIAGLATNATQPYCLAKSPAKRSLKQTSMGLIADLHHGLEPTAESRLDEFMDTMATANPDSIMQLGDFNYGSPSSKSCMELWNQFRGAKYHVLGNHDMDKYSKEHMLEFWEMPARYYSFDQGPFHFVVLDRNHLKRESKFIPYAKANFYVDGKFRGHADAEQLEWLKADLEKASKPSVVFSHQGLGMPAHKSPVVESNRPIEKLLREVNLQARKETGANKIVACFCGHHHLDRYHFQDGIHYVWINSASYYWVGSKYGRMAGYTKPLFATITFNEDHSIEIEGRDSDWADPSPAKRGYPNANKLSTCIKSRHLVKGKTSEPG